MNGALAVFRKEAIDHARDRRSLLSALMMPVFGPVMFALMMNLVASWTREDRTLVVSVAGMERAPSLVQFLERHNAVVTPAPPDYEARVREGQLDLALVIPDDYPKDFVAGKSAAVRLVVDDSRERTLSAVRRTQRLLTGYSQQLAALRLLARGVSPELAAPVTIEEEDLATPEKTAAKVLGMIPLFLLLAAFVGGMHLAIDATAGERERGSLEPLLSNPVARRDVVLGKWAAATLAAALGVTLTLAGFLVAVRQVPLHELGVQVRLGPAEAAVLLAAALPLTLFTAALELLVATFARTFKEAQSYISVLMLVPSVPGALLTFYPLKTTAWMAATPMLGQALLLNDALRGEPLVPAWFALAALGAIAAAALCLALCARLLADERIVFGR